MAPTVFFTGGTGYVGGDALARLHEVHPDWNYRLLNRDERKGNMLSKAYSSVQIVIGSLNDAQLLEEEARKADIVMHLADADNKVAAQAISRGLLSHPSTSPGFWLHCTGGNIFGWETADNGTWGEPTDKIWDDLDVEKIHQIPDRAMHREIDKIVFDCGAQGKGTAHTALVSPPCIFGTGRGLFNTRSIQLPDLAKHMIERQEVFQVGKGQAAWSHVHVSDLSEVWLLLAEAAAQGGGNASWDHDGYYFAEAGDGDHVWGDVSRGLGRVLKQKGLVANDTPTSYSADEVRKLHPFAAMLWGHNCRYKANRARKLLGWEAKGPKITDVYEDVVALEVARKQKT